MKKTFKTNNYEQFSHYEFNREVINELNIKAIMKEMLVHGFDEWNPIIVSATGKIADGQHRLEAAKRLGIDVHVDQYDREFTADEVRRMNKNRVNWKFSDFIHSQIDDELSVRMYSFIKECSLNGITQSSAIRIALAANHKSQNVNREFHGLTVEEHNVATDMLKELLMLKTYITNATSAMFVGAYIRAKSCENFSLETFITKLKISKFTCYTRMIDLINEIEEVYNFKNKNKITINRDGVKAR